MSSPDVTTLRTARLVGRRYEEGDFEDYARLFADERVAATLGGPIARDQARRFFDIGQAHWQAHGFGLWTFRAPSGEFVGRGGLRHVVVDGTPEVELAYSLAAAHWGRGLATEIARASAECAFGPLALDAIVAFTLITNARSQRVLHKSGFVYERDGERHDEPHRFYRLRRKSG